jgi:hypothetical protein
VEQANSYKLTRVIYDPEFADDLVNDYPTMFGSVGRVFEMGEELPDLGLSEEVKALVDSIRN